jgi:hypothetical protein
MVIGTTFLAPLLLRLLLSSRERSVADSTA